MAVTAESLIARYPTFAATSPTLIESCIAQASLLVDPDLWGSTTDAGIRALAAHFIWSDPMGTTTRLDGDGDGDPKKTSPYWRQYKQLQPLTSPIVT